MEFRGAYKILLSLSIVIPTIICSLSLSQLGKTSAYMAPIVSVLTIVHAFVVGTICFRESRREPTISPHEPRMTMTRRSNLIASYALYVLWVVTFILVVIATANVATWVLAPKGGIDKPRAAVEAGFTGIQACVTLVFAVLCTKDRRMFHFRRTRRHRWSWSWFQS